MQGFRYLLLALSHKLRPNVTSPGKMTVLTYSPDGYCLFAGYERGWAMWSVYGKPGATSFTAERTLSKTNNEEWLLSIKEAFWIGGGAELLMLSNDDNRFFVLEMARSAVTGCFSSANVSRSLMQTSTGFMIYRGYDLPDLTTISADVSLWHHVQIPSAYLVDQWPIRSAVISNDGRYVAIAGKRGLAHYSVNSGRWKMFDDPFIENEFTVRGGMCWFQHVLIAAIECRDSHEVCVSSICLFVETDIVFPRFACTHARQRSIIATSCIHRSYLRPLSSLHLLAKIHFSSTPTRTYYITTLLVFQMQA